MIEGGTIRCEPTYLFVLRRTGRVGYDQVGGFVVRATSEQHARQLAQEGAGDEGGAVWHDSTQSTCDRLVDDGEPSVILIDFRAG